MIVIEVVQPMMYLRALRTIFNDAIHDNEIKVKLILWKRKRQVSNPSSTGNKRALTKEELSKFNAHTETPEQESQRLLVLLAMLVME
jgi:hypothetical protein